MSNNDFYLGRIYDQQAAKTTLDPLMYDPNDLTTHGVIVGMTGSGKTGLCLDLMEEAALNNIPALMIDPKGDITNTLLHFPELLPSDFRPWVNADDAQRAGKSVSQVAADTAELWRNGLASWDIGGDRIQQLKDSAHFSIYTPGSDAGIPLSIVSSLAAPEIAWDSNKETLRERIGGTVTALLGLIGMTDIDPVQSREHILLSNIFEHAWSQGKDLSLGDLIMHTQNPPFEKLGFFEVSTFFPDKDRMQLALKLNNILASPSFQSWLEGEPLDIQSLMYTPDGKPRHTVFYIAHLNDEERMFFVTLLYSAVETWMRAQSGTSSLRALVYFDEIFGYLPPSANPPSKEPMLRLLKQARAFGVGMVLATQNPVDIDYKALSNAGTWFIGKLGTDQDKQRLLDGLESAIGTGASRAEYDRMISDLGKRVFLLRNVHDKEPRLFQTRWAMNYLAGPITRTRIGELNEMAGAHKLAAAAPVNTAASLRAASGADDAEAPMARPEPEPADLMPGTEIRPKLPARIAEYFLPNNLTLGQGARVARRDLASTANPLGLIYRPVILAQADVRVLNRKYDVDVETNTTAVVFDPDKRGMVRWENYPEAYVDPNELDRGPLPQARFDDLSAPFNDSSAMGSMKKDFVDWVYRNTEVMVRANEQLKVYAGPNVSAEDFKEDCLDAAQAEMNEEMRKLDTRFEKALNSLQKKLAREERELEEDRLEYSQRKREEGAKHLETLIGMFGGRRRSLSSSMSKRRMTAKAKADIEESEEEIERLEEEIREATSDQHDALMELREKWDAVAEETSEIKLQPYKKDVVADLFGVAWMPYHVVEEDGRVVELPGYGSE